MFFVRLLFGEGKPIDESQKKFGSRVITNGRKSKSPISVMLADAFATADI